MFVWHGEVYIDKEDKDLLKNEEKYVKKRYQAVARSLTNKPFKISRKEAAKIIGKSLRQLYRILRRFKEEGISGLRFKSKRPKTSPNKTPEHIEKKIVCRLFRKPRIILEIPN